MKPSSAGYSNCNDNDNPKCANCVAAALSKAVKSTLRLMSTGKRMCRTEMLCSPYAHNKVKKLQTGGRRGGQSKNFKWGRREAVVPLAPMAEPPLADLLRTI